MNLSDFTDFNSFWRLDYLFDNLLVYRKSILCQFAKDLFAIDCHFEWRSTANTALNSRIRNLLNYLILKLSKARWVTSCATLIKYLLLNFFLINYYSYQYSIVTWTGLVLILIKKNCLNFINEIFKKVSLINDFF